MTPLFQRLMSRNFLQPARRFEAVRKAESLLKYAASEEFREEADRRIAAGLETLGLARRADLKALEERLRELEVRWAEARRPTPQAAPAESSEATH